MLTWKYLIRRLILVLFVLWGITTITFLLMVVVPRNPAIAMAGSTATSEQIEAFNERWGLNKPLHERYISFYANVLHGDLGRSIRTGRPVLQEIANYFPATFELANFALIIGIILGIPLGILSAIKRNQWLDQIGRVFSLIGVSTPNFLLGLIILLIFYAKLHIFEPGRLSIYSSTPATVTGMYLVDSLLSGEWSVFIDSLKHLVMPALTLGLLLAGYIARLTRASMLEVLARDYIKAVKARGLSNRTVIFKHALRNALIPTVSILGILYGNCLAGVIIVETVFAYPGLGYFAYASILKADQPSIMGITLTIAVFYCFINFIVDFTYHMIDPRIRYEN
jgi:peptide/nickel transport system permease protein